MKYEYQDLILKTLLQEYKESIDVHSLDQGEIVVTNSHQGVCVFQDVKNYSPHITVNHGSVLNVTDKHGDDMAIYFTVYVISTGYDNKVHYLCNVESF